MDRRTAFTPLCLALALFSPATSAASMMGVKQEPLFPRSKGISCAANPFGSQLTLGFEQEVVLTRVLPGGGATQHQLDVGSANPNTFVVQRQNLVAADFVASSLRHIDIDLDGDGRQELAMVGVKAGAIQTLQVRVLRPSADDPTANQQVDDYTLTVGSSALVGIDVARGDLDGNGDGRQELVVGFRSGTTGRHTVIALGGNAQGEIAQGNGEVLARWDQPASQVAQSGNLRVAVGDVLLEGRDQVVVMTTRSNGGELAWNLLRFEGTDNPGTPEIRFDASAPLFSETVNPGPVRRLTFQIADLGGTAAREMVIHDQRNDNGAPMDTLQRVRWFETTRSPANPAQITGISLGLANPSLTTTLDTASGPMAAAVGNLDRTPGNEIVALRQDPVSSELHVVVQKVEFTGTGVPAAIMPPGTPMARAIVPTFSFPLTQLDLAIGDADGDSLFEAYVALRDAAGDAGGPQVSKVWRFGFARPQPIGGPVVPQSFSRTAAFEFSNLADSASLQVHTADWNRDSVLARIGVNCRRVREPQVRSVVAMPPYWERLQGGLDGFGASIGRSVTSGVSSGSQYDTFSSHDVSAYIGLQVGGEVLGIGAQATAKATAGYNYQTTRSTFDESSFETTATQSQFSDSIDGEGLVVVELNTYDCFDFEVLRDGVVRTDSDFRACELIRAENGVNLRSLQSTDLLTWDTVTAAGVGSRPSQWMPLHPDWASVALFRPARASMAPGTGNPADAVDGRFDTGLVLGQSQRPFLEIDLGEVRDVSNIRVWPLPGEAARLRGFNLYASASPFAGNAPPGGAGVRTFAPDPLSGNGTQSWSVWTREAASPHAPMLARYIRLQHPGAAQLRVAEIQVFGDVHKDPPAYPVEVCDPVLGDGRFNAVVADVVANPRRFRVIDLRGDLSWSTVAIPPGGSGPLGCPGNDPDLPTGDIWNSTLIGATAGAGQEWNLENRNQDFFQTTNSISKSYRVGAELDLEAGAVVQVVAGGAYEYSQGVTRADTTSMYWGSGMQYGGRAVGWNAGTGAGCDYAPQPYAYVRDEEANSGYGHKFTVVDYVVRPSSATWNPIGPNFPPADCENRPDFLFSGDFE
jgi:hypothetical protein